MSRKRTHLVDDKTKDKIVALRDQQGISYKHLAERFDLAVGSINRILMERRKRRESKSSANN